MSGDRIAPMRRGYVQCLSVGLAVACWSLAVAQVRLPRVSVYLEDSPAAQELVHRAERLRAQDRLAEAAAVYQQVIEQYPHKLMARGKAMHTDAVRWIRGTLLSDDQLFTAYRGLYTADSQRVLKAACTPAPRAEALEEVLARYEICRAGLEAGLMLAALYLEQANPEHAGLVLDELAEHPDLPTQVVWWHQLQIAAGLLGSTLTVTSCI